VSRSCHGADGARMRHQLPFGALGTAGGFSAHGAEIGDVFLSTNSDRHLGTRWRGHQQLLAWCVSPSKMNTLLMRHASFALQMLACYAIRMI
jgi:hypothetical protein